MKRFFAILLCLCVTVSFSACGASGPKGGSGSSEPSSVDSGGMVTAPSSDASEVLSSSGQPTDSDAEDSGNTSDAPEHNMVLAGDGYNHRVVLYDLDLLQPGDYLEQAEVWSLDGIYGTGIKYRENTVFGDVIVLADNIARIVSYPSKEVLWETGNPGNNSHSIEILPSGNVVIANSTGGHLRMFYTSALLTGDTEGAQKYVDYELYDAHGVLWDPEYDVLWAVGGDELIAYSVRGEGSEQFLSPIGGMGAQFPTGKKSGHDLSADLTDSRYLYVSVGSGVFRFDKETNVLEEKFPQYAKVSHKGIKGFGVNPQGNFFFCYPNGGPGTAWENETRASWSTDTLHFAYWKTENFLYVQTFKSEFASFYKCRVFCGRYQ